MSRKQNRKPVEDAKRVLRGVQGPKDSSDKRVNFDNVRKDKLRKDLRRIDASNDPMWYAKNVDMLTAAASYNFSNTTGLPLNWDGRTTGTPDTIPGVMQIGFLPTIGGWSDTAINAAKESIYSYVVHANSRNTTYDSSDLMLLILAGVQVFSFIASGIRAYGVARLYDQRNDYLPDALLAAMGFDPIDIRSQLPQMWFDLNELITRSSQIWIPNTMPILTRQFWMNSNVYMDAESVKAQYYVLTQQSFLAYEALSDTKGGRLGWIRNDGTVKPYTAITDWYNNITDQHTWDEYMTAINGMFHVLLNSTDRGVIMGDILKAYGPDKIYALQPLNVDYTVTPVYDREVLSQIENCDVFSTQYYYVAQNTDTDNTLSTQWGQWATGYTVSGDALPTTQSILNFHQKEAPTPAQIMVATRLKALGSHVLSNVNDATLVGNVIPDTMGTEYVVSVNVFINIDNVLTQATLPTKGSASSTSMNVGIVYIWAAFDWCPWLYRINIGNVGPSVKVTDFTPATVVEAIGDYDYSTTIRSDSLKKMHTTAVYSEFDVPVI